MSTQSPTLLSVKLEETESVQQRSSFTHKGHLFFYSLFIEHLPAVTSYSVYFNPLKTTRNIKPWTLLYQKETFSDQWPSWIKILCKRIFSGLLSIGNNVIFMFFYHVYNVYHITAFCCLCFSFFRNPPGRETGKSEFSRTQLVQEFQ